MLLGYASGKVGSLVFARRAGEQVTRPYNAHPANPRSLAQMKQRTKWGNLINVYRILRPFIQLGMQDKPLNQSDYNRFIGLNLGPIDGYLLKEEVAQGAALLAPYTLTSGSLASLDMQSAKKSSVYVGLPSLDGQTVGAVSAAIINNNSFLQVGDQITFIAMVQTLRGNVPHLAPAAAKFVLADASANTPFADAVYSVGDCHFAIADGYLAYDFDAQGITDFGAAIIASRNSGGNLLVSTSKVFCQFKLGGDFQSEGFATTFEDAAVSYGYTNPAFLSPSDPAGSLPVAAISSVSYDGSTVANGASIKLSAGTKNLVIFGENFTDSNVSVMLDGSAVDVTYISPTQVTASLTIKDTSKAVTISAGESSFTIRLVVDDGNNPL